MKLIFFITLAALFFSYIHDKQKTTAGIKSGIKMFLGILSTIFVLILVFSVLLYFLPDGVIVHYLGKNAGFSAYIIAALIGSIALIPGFIAYPLAGILLKNGVSYQVIAIFISTLLMVGVITIPLEARYFGWKVAVLRNFLYLLGAFLTGTIVGLIM
jgi:uncharacterized membrane protein YraQ (UPF0718 family)